MIVIVTSKYELWIMKKPKKMNTMEKFERICERMMSADSSTFKEFCKGEGLSETRADNLFYANFGVSGEEFLSKIRNPPIVIAI